MASIHPSPNRGKEEGSFRGPSTTATLSPLEKEQELEPVPASDVNEEIAKIMARRKPLVRIKDDEIERLTLKNRVWQFLDDPSSGFAAQCFSLALIALITFSVVVFCVETLPRFSQAEEQPGYSVWDIIELFSVVVFTTEYVLRLLSCPDKVEFLKSILNFIDLIAIVPFYLEQYIEFIGGNSAVFRVVRLVRVFRVFKISRYLSWIRIFMEAMRQSAQPLTMLLFVMMIGCVFFSSGMFFIERGELQNGVYVRSDNKTSPFQSIPGTFWWCIVTMTTVGYGDAVPITPLGKLLASITSLTGILVLAIPITIISTNFSVEYEKLKKQRETVRARVMLLKNHFKEKRSDLDAMQVEIEDIVKRASNDFLHEVEELVERSKEVMTLELQELVKIAYQSRQRDLQQAFDSFAANDENTSEEALAKKQVVPDDHQSSNHNTNEQ